MDGALPPRVCLQGEAHQVQVPEPIIEAPGVLVEEGHSGRLSEGGAQEEGAADGPVVVSKVRARPRAEGLQLQLADEEGVRS